MDFASFFMQRDCSQTSYEGKVSSILSKPIPVIAVSV